MMSAFQSIFVSVFQLSTELMWQFLAGTCWEYSIEQDKHFTCLHNFKTYVLSTYSIQGPMLDHLYMVMNETI